MAFIRKIKRNGRVYLARVENYRDGGKVKQRHLEYLGLDPASKIDDFSFYNRDISMKSIRVHGPVIVLESIAREMGLFELFGDISNSILTLVFAHCMDYKSVAETEKWFEKTDLGSVLGIEKITSNQLYSAIEELSNFDFDEIEKSIFENMTSLFGVDKSGVIYDGTNTHLLGSLSALAKKGKDKEGVRGRNIIQIGLGITRELGIPVFHQVHEGNIHDTKMFQEAILKFETMGIKKGLSVFDRGITSANCISKLSALGWKCLAGLQNHRGVKSTISKLDFENVRNFKNMVIQGETKFFVQSVPFKIGSTSGKLIILQNYMKKQKLAIHRMQLIEDTKELVKSAPEEVGDELKKFFNKDGKINHHAVDRAERGDGLSFLFTNAKLSHKEAVAKYFAKDLVERYFRLSKSTLKLRPIRFSLDDRIKSHILICYIGLNLLTTVRLRLEKQGIYRDPGAVLRDLESIYKVYFVGKVKNGKSEIAFDKVNTLSNKQKKIISIIAPNLEM